MICYSSNRTDKTDDGDGAARRGIKDIWLGDWKDGYATKLERLQEDKRVGRESTPPLAAAPEGAAQPSSGHRAQGEGCIRHHNQGAVAVVGWIDGWMQARSPKTPWVSCFEYQNNHTY